MRGVIDRADRGPYNARVAVAIVACRNHPAREAIGVCVKCRARVCAECSTKVDGINHCVECLGALAKEARAAGGAASSSGVASVVAASALLGVLSVLAYALLEGALP